MHGQNHACLCMESMGPDGTCDGDLHAWRKSACTHCDGELGAWHAIAAHRKKEMKLPSNWRKEKALNGREGSMRRPGAMHDACGLHRPAACCCWPSLVLVPHRMPPLHRCTREGEGVRCAAWRGAVRPPRGAPRKLRAFRGSLPGLMHACKVCVRRAC